MQASLYRPGQSAAPPDVLVLSKRYDADSLDQAQALRARHGTRLVLDLCDNHFFSSTDAPAWQARAERLSIAARSVDLVVTSTEALAEVVRREAGAELRTTVIGDAAEPPYTPSPLARWPRPMDEWRLAELTRRLRPEQGCRLVWFGHHGIDYAEGGMLDLAKLRPRLELASTLQALSLTVISNNRHKFDKLTRGWALPVHYLEWRPNTVSRALQMHQVALIPINPNPYTRCKTNNRLATALLHGLAVAADSIPSYQDFADDCALDDWEQGLQRLISEPVWRLSQVQSGVARIEREWQLNHLAEQWRQTLTQLSAR